MDLPFSLPELLWIAFSLLFAGFVKGATGLGYSTTALPLLALAIGLKPALPLVLAPSIASNLAVLAGVGPLGPAFGRFTSLLIAAPVGVALGLALLGRIDGASAGAALGHALLAWIAFSLARPHWRAPPRLERPLSAPVGLFTGVINGLTGSQVLPVTPYLMSLDLPRPLFIATLNLSFTLSSLVMASGLAWLGLLTPTSAAISLSGVVVALVGVRSGEALRRRLPEAAFRNAVLAVLGLSALALIWRAL
ncbi:MAG: sulfite exporter TauE/SafE family protein [Pseudomonadota bacterium]